MPDIPNRDELEAHLARLFAKLSQAQMGRILEELGDPPRMENVSEDFWLEYGEEYLRAFRPFLETVYLEAAQRLMGEVPIGVSWELVNEAAADWASTYTYRLVSGIEATTRQYLQNHISRYYRDAQTMGDVVAGLSEYDEFKERVGRLFGVARVEAIAITEVTRAAVEGEREIAAEVAAAGIQMIEYWQTNNDDRVCPICLPRHGIAEGKGTGDAYWTKRDGPPGHTRCRCWTVHRIVRPEESAP